ncbi:DNA polymerase III subunit gamma/tau [Sulfurihydrogenibium sp.]|uniref:DNA polymerase III subunit gamma/tau n=1 Tax=Sulfurihydrogenibium sp. TaxID=2053621 RepID=UPI002606E0BF|nr:DNA polymerase III subunit gamma/tau [Sulfurihydrogenibium sp.]
MTYEAFSRKYRPKSFKEVIGQDFVVKTLKNAVKLGRISHAYIFSGSRGVGKTTIARILAKVLNCKNPVDYEPCNQCENCIEIDKGSFPDMYEIDAASNRGIDDIRTIRDNVNYQPIKGKYKAYIIDEAHMLTKEAFNALLKTLEEPPPRNIFILATTELYKIPDTIKSRCQVFLFKPPTKSQIKTYLLRILENENIPYEEEAVDLLAQELEGGMRDSASLLDQAVTYSEGKLTVKSVEELLGIVPLNYIKKALNYIKNQEIQPFIKLLDEVEDNGYDINIFWKELLSNLQKSLINIVMNQKDEHFSNQDLKTLIYIKNLFNKAYSEARTFVNPKDIYQIYILKLSYIDAIKSIQQLIEGNFEFGKTTPQQIQKESTQIKESTEQKTQSEENQNLQKIITQIIKNEKIIAPLLKEAEIKEEENSIFIKLKDKSQEEILSSHFDILKKYFPNKNINISAPQVKDKKKDKKRDEVVDKVLELFPGSKILTYKEKED